MTLRTLFAFCFAFLLIPGLKAQNSIIEAEYFIGSDPGFGNATSIDIAQGEDISEAFTAALSSIEEGFQFACVRVKNENDMWSIPVKVPFRISQTDVQEVVAAEWYINNEPGFGNAEQVDVDTDQNIQDLIEASTELLPAGRNNFYVRVQDAEGNWGIPIKRPFIVNEKVPLDVVAAEYFIDQDPGINSAIPIEITNPDHFVQEELIAEIEDDLPEGDHFLYIRVQNDELVWSIHVIRPFTVDNSLGIDNILNQNIKVYPNPTNGPVNIDLGDLRLISVDIINSKGQLVKSISENTSQQLLPDLESGMYLLRITTAEGQITKAIVVN